MSNDYPLLVPGLLNTCSFISSVNKTCEDLFNLQMVNDLPISYQFLCQYLLAKYLMIEIIMSIA